MLTKLVTRSDAKPNSKHVNFKTDHLHFRINLNSISCFVYAVELFKQVRCSTCCQMSASSHVIWIMLHELHSSNSVTVPPPPHPTLRACESAQNRETITSEMCGEGGPCEEINVCGEAWNTLIHQTLAYKRIHWSAVDLDISAWRHRDATSRFYDGANLTRAVWMRQCAVFDPGCGRSRDARRHGARQMVSARVLEAPDNRSIRNCQMISSIPEISVLSRGRISHLLLILASPPDHKQRLQMKLCERFHFVRFEWCETPALFARNSAQIANPLRAFVAQIYFKPRLKALSWNTCDFMLVMCVISCKLTSGGGGVWSWVRET